jgi:signal peptidase I
MMGEDADPAPSRAPLEVRSGPILVVALVVAVAFVNATLLLSSQQHSATPSSAVIDYRAACASPNAPLGFAFDRVNQEAMVPAIEPNDLLLLDTYVAGITRGAIVVFLPPAPWGDGTTPFDLRVVGLPGETVAIGGGHVSISGGVLTEPYVSTSDLTLPAPNGGLSSWQIPAGQVFVMADRRSNSVDSRFFGPIPLTSVIGQVVYRCSPSSSEGPVG